MPDPLDEPPPRPVSPRAPPDLEGSEDDEDAESPRAKTHVRSATKTLCRRGASEQSAQEADDAEYSRHRCQHRKSGPARGLAVRRDTGSKQAAGCCPFSRGCNILTARRFSVIWSMRKTPPGLRSRTAARCAGSKSASSFTAAALVAAAPAVLLLSAPPNPRKHPRMPNQDNVGAAPWRMNSALLSVSSMS